MRTLARRLVTAMAVGALMLIGAAQAQRQSAPVRSYTPIDVTLPELQGGVEWDAFRRELAKVARARIYADLARLVAAQDFFWGRDFSGRFDPRKPGVDNLAAALRLEHDNGAGWAHLARLADEVRAAPLEAHPGVICAPAAPQFDIIAFDQLVELTRTQAGEWAYPRAADVAVRAAPSAEAATMEILGMHFVRVLQRAVSRPDGWTQVVAPGGAVGFVAPDTLRRANPPRLCYGRDPLRQWQIVGYIDRGD